MVFVKALGFFDFLAAVFILLGQFHLVSWRILLVCALYLIAKGIMFFHDWASKADIIVGIYCVVLLFLPLLAVSIIAASYLFIKALFSIFV